MIRELKKDDVKDVVKIWFDTNIKAHSFINNEYWVKNFKFVEEAIPKSKVYVYEEDDEIKGFIGLNNNYIQGLFVKEKYQRNGIGKKMVDYVKDINESLELKVYSKNIKAIEFYEREDFKIKSKDMDDATGEIEYTMYWNR